MTLGYSAEIHVSKPTKAVHVPYRTCIDTYDILQSLLSASPTKAAKKKKIVMMGFEPVVFVGPGSSSESSFRCYLPVSKYTLSSK